MKQLILFPVFALMILSCGKPVDDLTPPPQDLIKVANRDMLNYYPDDALSEVQNFLAATQTFSSMRKSTTEIFPDKTISEAGWTVEASLNYLKNVNMTKPTVRQITKTLEVTNTTTSEGELRISGADLTAKYDLLMADITTEETTDATTAKLADVRITEVSPIKTQLEIKIDMGKDLSMLGAQGGGCNTGLTIAEGITAIEQSINSQLANGVCQEGYNPSFPNGADNYCEWYANVENIFIPNFAGLTIPDHMTSGYITENPQAWFLPEIEGLDTQCFFTEGDVVEYETVTNKMEAYGLLMMNVALWEVNDICSPYNSYRIDQYNNCILSSAVKPLEVVLSREGFYTNGMALSLNELTIASSSLAY